MNWEKFFIFIGWFLLCFLACSFIGLLMIGIIVGIVLLFQFNVYVTVGIIIGVMALYMTINIMKEY